jgi:hypothetical protein
MITIKIGSQREAGRIRQAESDSGKKGAGRLSGMTMQKRYVPQNMLDLHSQQGTPSEFMSVLNYSM